jgi:hypothetical protein
MDNSTEKLEPTIGEKRVRTSFNVSNDKFVDRIKNETASIINQIDSLKDGSESEKLRLIALAQTAYEEAAMWAVKAATF